MLKTIAGLAGLISQLRPKPTIGPSRTAATARRDDG